MRTESQHSYRELRGKNENQGQDADTKKNSAACLVHSDVFRRTKTNAVDRSSSGVRRSALYDCCCPGADKIECSCGTRRYRRYRGARQSPKAISEGRLPAYLDREPPEPTSIEGHMQKPRDDRQFETGTAREERENESDKHNVPSFVGPPSY